MKITLPYLIVVLVVVLLFYLSLAFNQAISEALKGLGLLKNNPNITTIVQGIVLGPFLLLLLMFAYIWNYKKGRKRLLSVMLSLFSTVVIYTSAYFIFKQSDFTANSLFKDHRGYPVNILVVSMGVLLSALSLIAYIREKKNT